MKKNFIYLIASLLFFACSDNGNTGSGPLEDARPIELRAALVPKIEQDNTFAFDLFKQVYQTDESKSNVFVSPLSVSMALSMTLNGAKGSTYDEMVNALRISGFSIDEINEYCQTLKNALLKVDPSTEISIANSIWYQQGFPVENYFLYTNKQYFGAEITEADFVNPATLTRINKWSSDNTRGKIPAILEQIPAEAVMYLINAVYFKGIWKSKFDKKSTVDGTFYNGNGIKRLVPMMSQTGQFEYYADDVARYLTLLYGNGAFSMKLLLPNEGKTIDDVINHLDFQSWYGSFEINPVREVYLQLPRFKTECKYMLNEKVLPAMGMITPFSSFADFTGISRGGGLKISEVIHKTYISVDEEGTEAAAVTSVGMEFTSAGPSTPINYIVDKPFVFLIQENSTGAVLFMGAINEL